MSKSYPKYKKSGVAWLGDVPTSWHTGTLRWLASRYSGGTPDKSKLEYWDNGTIPWLNSGAVNDKIITEPSTYISDEAFANSSAKWIPKFALVMALAGQGKTKGTVAQLHISSTCNQSMAAIVPGEAIIPRFLYWWLDSNYQNIRNLAGGDMRDGLNLELLGSIHCPLPPLDEQQSIIAFLDHETAKIDALVEEQRRLIELLKEKRQAVISHAVTKGLNPNAPMKDSGIEWLGEVPEHWRVLRVRHMATSVQTGLTPSTTYPSENLDIGMNWYTPGDFGDTLWLSTSTKKIPPELAMNGEARLFPAGSVLVVSIGATLGKVGAVASASSANQQINAIIPHKDVDATFLAYSLSVKAEVMRHLSNASTIGIMNQEKTKEMVLAIPPHAEQRDICTYLDRMTEELDKLIDNTRSSTALLKERRTALISAAVTGKIDVRNFTVKETEAA